MGRKRVPGLIKRAGIWHIDKRIFGRRICQSTDTACLEEAERHLARVMEETRQAQIYGVRPVRTFEQAAAKFVRENQHKRSIGDDVSRLKGLMPWIGHVQLDRLHMGTLQAWIAQRGKAGAATSTINHGLQISTRKRERLETTHVPRKVALASDLVPLRTIRIGVITQDFSERYKKSRSSLKMATPLKSMHRKTPRRTSTFRRHP